MDTLLLYLKKFILCTTILVFPLLLSAQVLHQQRVITDFSSIDIEGGFNVHLLQGDDEKVIIETTNADVFNTIDIINNSGTLTVRSRGLDTGGIYKVALFIYFKSLDQITARLLSGSFDSYTQLNLDRLELNINGAMMVKLMINCSDLQVKMSNVFTSIMQGIVSGNADFTLSTIKTFFAANLQTETMTVTCSEIKNGTVWTNRELNVDAHGFGSLKYKGDPILGNMTVKQPFTVVKE
jgi:hypothetical protein